MSDFKAITTQEEFDEAIKDRLARQKESIEKEYEDYAELKARNGELETKIGTLESSLSEVNKTTEQHDKEIADRDAKIAEYETANMRTKIALQHGIPYDLAGRLVGEDEESIIEDAKKLSQLVGNTEPPAPLKDVEPPISEGKDGAYKTLLENLDLEGE